MKKIVLALAAAIMALAPVSMAHAQSLYAQHGPFSVVKLDSTACGVGARNASGVTLMIVYDSLTDQLTIAAVNPAVTLTHGQNYPVQISIDGRTVTWTGKGARLDNGVVALELIAGDATDAFTGLVRANGAVTFSVQGRELIRLNSDANFDYAMIEMVECTK
jgi:hypothetical protein